MHNLMAKLGQANLCLNFRGLEGWRPPAEYSQNMFLACLLLHTCVILFDGRVKMFKSHVFV